MYKITLFFVLQSSVLESILRLACANPTNLTTLLKLCLASELPSIAAIGEATDLAAKQAAKQQQPQLPSIAAQSPVALSPVNSPSAKCLMETIKTLCAKAGELHWLPFLSSLWLTSI